MLIWLSACSSTPLADVPIEGGTADMRAHVSAGLAFLDDAVGPGRVRLRAVRIEPIDGLLGSYHHGTRTVTLDPDASIGSVLRHELCHALVDQDDLRDQAPATLERVSDLLFDPENPHNPDVDGTDYPTAELRWSEAVAQLCEAGPYWASDAVDNVCSRLDEPEPELTEAAAAWMLDHVWSDFGRPEPLVLDPADTVDVAWAATLEEIAPTTDPRVVVVTSEDGEQHHYDLYDGSEVPSDLPARDNATDLPTGSGLTMAPGSGAGWTEGPAAVHGNWHPEPLGGGTLRVLAHDGVEWRFVGDGCGGGERWMFTADDAVWMVHGGGWTALGRR